MKKILPIITLLFLIGFNVKSAPAAEAVGSVLSLEGRATAVDSSFKLRTLQVDDQVYLNDLIQTDAGAKIQIKFIDGSLLGQGERSQIKINTYVFNPNGKDKPRAGLRLLKGVFRLITDQITRMNPEGYEIETNYGTIGIRGCELCFIIAADGEEIQVVGLHHADSVIIEKKRFITPASVESVLIEKDMQLVTVDKKQGLSNPVNLPSSRVAAIYAETTPSGAAPVVIDEEGAGNDANEGASDEEDQAPGDADDTDSEESSTVAEAQSDEPEADVAAVVSEQFTIEEENEDGETVTVFVEEWEEGGQTYRKTVTAAKQVVQFDAPNIGNIDDVALVNLDPASAAPTRFLDHGAGSISTKQDVVLDLTVPEAIVDETVLVMPEAPPPQVAVTPRTSPPPEEPQVIAPPVLETPVVVEEPTPDPILPEELPPEPVTPTGPAYPIVKARAYTVLQDGTDWSYEQWEQETIDLVGSTPQSTFKFGTRVQGEAIRGTDFLNLRDGAQIYNLSGSGFSAAAVTKGDNSYVMNGTADLGVTIGGAILPTWDGDFNLSNPNGASLTFGAAGSFSANGLLQGTVSGYSLSSASGNPASQSIRGTLVGPGSGATPITGVAGEFDFSHSDGTLVDGVFGADLN